MDKEFKRLLNHIIYREPFESIDGAGDITYGTAVSLRSFVYGGTLRATPGVSELQTPNYVIYVDEINGALFDIRDRLTLPDGKKYPIKKLTPIFNEKALLEAVEVIV